MAVKMIDAAALSGITTGIVMTEFAAIHEALEWIMGHPIWTHEIPGIRSKAVAEVLRQFPDMPTEVADHWTETAKDVRARYGAKVEVVQGLSERTADPIESLTAMLGGKADNVIAVVSTDSAQSQP